MAFGVGAALGAIYFGWSSEEVVGAVARAVGMVATKAADLQDAVSGAMNPQQGRAVYGDEVDLMLKASEKSINKKTKPLTKYGREQYAKVFRNKEFGNAPVKYESNEVGNE